MDKSLVAGVLQCGGNLTDDLAGIGNRQRTDSGDQFAQVKPVDVFGDQDRGAVDFSRVVRGHDVGVAELADGAHFGFKPIAGTLV